VDRLELGQPENDIARTAAEAVEKARRIGYPLVVRPSYVLGGRAMEIVYDRSMLERYMAEAVRVSPEHPILLDAFLERAVEFDVDALSDGQEVWVGGVMQHIEAAGVHSGDSGCSLPPVDVPEHVVTALMEQTRRLALEIGVVGLMNIQFAVRGEEIFLLEVNPRASRTVPFVSKTTGIPMAKLATKLMLGARLREFDLPDVRRLPYVAVKESVFPFHRFPGVDTLLGPEMKSTGEVMGIDDRFSLAFAKASIAAGTVLPAEGTVFVSVSDRHKPLLLDAVAQLGRMGFRILATEGTRRFLAEHGVESERVLKVAEGRPNIVDAIKSESVAMVINTPTGAGAARDSYSIRRSALEYGEPYFTTVEAALAAVEAVAALRERSLGVRPIQEWHRRIAAGAGQKGGSPPERA
jgi:carbamoyl-phosphate synthase large subunit